jgi:hypothetical protein
VRHASHRGAIAAEWRRVVPHIRPRPARLLALTLAALIALIALATPAGAQPDPSVDRVTVGAVLCADTPCYDHDELLGGFEIAAIDTTTGDVLASCVTGAAPPHTCVLELPAGASYDLAWDDAQIPEGYAWTGSLLHVADGPIGTATLIPLAPAQPIAPVAEPGHVVVQAALCADATCNAFSGYLDLFVITAVDPVTGSAFSSCATGNLQQGLEHQCILDVPADGAYALEWFPDQVPTGYVPYGEPFPVGEPVVMTLGFVPEATDAVVTPAPSAAPTITALPSTGAGPGGESGPSLASWLALAAAALAGLCGIVARNRALATARSGSAADTPRR